MENQAPEVRELSMEERKACHLFEAGMYYGACRCGIPPEIMPEVLGILNECCVLYSFSLLSVEGNLTTRNIVRAVIDTLNERIAPDGGFTLPTLEEALQQEHVK